MFECLFPCRRSFPTRQRLRQHYKNTPECKERWRRRQDFFRRAAFARLNQTGTSVASGTAAGTPDSHHSGRSGLSEAHVEDNDAILQSQSPLLETEGPNQSRQTPFEFDADPFGSCGADEVHQLYGDLGSSMGIEMELLADEDTLTDQDTRDNQRDDEILPGSTLPPIDNIKRMEEASIPAESLLEEQGNSREDSADESVAAFEAWMLENVTLHPNPHTVSNNPLNDESPGFDDADNGQEGDEQEEEGGEENQEGRQNEGEGGSNPLEPEQPAPRNRPQPCPDEDEDDESLEIETFPRAGEIKATGESHFAKLERLQKAGGQNNLYHPFADAAEFELVQWLNDLPLSKVDSFIQLEHAKRSAPSFGSGKGMREMIGALPKPRMQWNHIEVIPESGTPAEPVFLCYRNPLAAVRSLLDRPALQQHLTFTPIRKWKDKSTEQRLYDEIFTGDWAWETQADLEPGSTLIPIILGSDEAHLTQYSGNKSAWPLYLSIGNIHSSIRNKPTKKCWILIAYIPTPAFTDPKNIHTALCDRLFHQCLSLILQPLKQAGSVGRHLQDSLGNRCHCFLRIAAYLADNPEQTMINVAAPNNSPVTIAGYRELGDPKPSDRRTRDWIIGKIDDLRKEVDPMDVEQWQTRAKEHGLNAVHKPFWEDLPGYEPDLVMAPDILHGLHRFWRDHPLKWVRNLVGVAELDRRVRTLQPIVGYRHFSKGISSLSQWSGREDRELQRYLVAAIVGAPRVDADSLFCLRRLHDFIYIAQYRCHSTKSLYMLSEALKDFHRWKFAFVRNGARRGKKKVLRHFRIPKMAGLHMYPHHIPLMGSSMQFSTEIIETCHKTMTKIPFKATNRKNFVAQMCAYMDRQATIGLMEDLGTWTQSRGLERQAPMTVAPQYDNVGEQRAQLEKGSLEKEVAVCTQALRGHIWHTTRPDQRGLSLRQLTTHYQLPGAFEAIAQYLELHESTLFEISNLLKFDIWYRCRIQLPLAEEDSTDMAETGTVQALPPSVTGTRFGLCNCGLVKVDQNAKPSGLAGYRVAQVRIIFKGRFDEGHPLKDVPLAYVYWFSPTQQEADDNVEMYSVRYMRHLDNRRIGSVVPLAFICRLVQLVPQYGTRVHPDLNSNNSMDIWRAYYINSFFDKECYQVIW